MPTSAPLSQLIDAASVGDRESVRKALEAEPEIVDQLDEKRRSALHYAAEGGHRDACEVLLHAGADPNVRTGELVRDGELRRDWYWEPGETPLILAVGRGHASVAELLVECGADVRAQTRWGWTALHGAAGNNDQKLIDLLLTRGADPDAWCWMRSFDEELDWYYYGTPLHTAAAGGVADAVHGLMSHGAVERECSATRRTPLFYAAAYGRTEAIVALCEHGSSPNIREHRYGYGSAFFDYTPLHYAAHNGHAEAVVALLSHGAEPRALDSYSARPALEMAEDEGHAEVAGILLQKSSVRSRIMPNGSDRDWVRFCAALEGFRSRHGNWPTRVRIEAGYVDALEYILGADGLNRVRQHLLLEAEEGKHFVAEDDRGRTYDYSSEGFAPERLSPTAQGWLGVEPLPREW
jgi:ankyrin repeat protein